MIIICESRFKQCSASLCLSVSYSKVEPLLIGDSLLGLVHQRSQFVVVLVFAFPFLVDKKVQVRISTGIPLGSEKIPNIFKDFQERLHTTPPMKSSHRLAEFESMKLWSMSQTLTNYAHTCWSCFAFPFVNWNPQKTNGSRENFQLKSILW